MKTTQFVRKQAQAGFTLIELIVVIVILGILAATALPRMFDMSGQARLAKMQAALGAVKAAQATSHAAWLMNGAQYACTNCGMGPSAQTGSLVSAESQNVVMLGGYPDVGNDGIVNAAPATAIGGMVTAANLSTTDYQLAATATTLTVSSDAAHPTCKFTYTEPVQSAGTAGTATAVGGQPTVTTQPAIVENTLTLANCQ
jgi:MSHA pilin protein MshA